MLKLIRPSVGFFVTLVFSELPVNQVGAFFLSQRSPLLMFPPFVRTGRPRFDSAVERRQRSLSDDGEKSQVYDDDNKNSPKIKAGDFTGGHRDFVHREPSLGIEYHGEV
jgi:hypothetical protein